MQGLIIENSADLYKVEANNSIYGAVGRGKIKNNGESIAVGDIVAITVTDESTKKAVINEILLRKTYIKRPKLANITQIILVMSCKNPKPDLLMIDKQLAFAEYLNIKPVIVLNKADLDEKQEFQKIKNVYQQIGYKVIITEAKNGNGIEGLKNLLNNNINAFSGNSGVGKSTLINQIFSSKITQEGEISKRNKKGKNTTTNCTLYKINQNTYIADTPGFSTFSIDEIESKNLDNYFIEFSKNKQLCEFIDCSHIRENNCHIKQLLNQNKISLSRYNNYCKIYEDLKKREEHKW